MKELFYKMIRYCMLFIGLYVGSAIVVNIFKVTGVEYNNSSDAAFLASVSAFLVLLSLNKLTKKPG